MIINGRPCTNENNCIDKALLTDLPYADILNVGEWIRYSIRPSRSKCGHTSYGLKHILENDTGIYLTNNAFKDAMLLAGYRPINPDDVNWTFRCIYVPELVINHNNFFTWASLHYGQEISPRGDFCRDMVQDKGFPVFAEKSIILNYLNNSGACTGAISAFESLWKDFETFKSKKTR